MRLMRLATNYAPYLDGFYASRPGMGDAPYDVQRRALADDCFLWADFWGRSLARLGYEVWEPVGNAGPAQKAWARENGVSYGETTWVTDILAAQVRRFRPDVLFVGDHNAYRRAFIERLRREAPSIRLVLGWCGAPYADEDVFKAHDIILTNIPGLVTRFRGWGARCEYLCHAFEPSVLERIGPPGAPETDFSFVGSVVKHEGYHNRREDLLLVLIDKAGLEIWGDVSSPTEAEREAVRRARRRYDLVHAAMAVPGMAPLLKSLPKIRTYARMPQPPGPNPHHVDPRIASRARPGVYGLAMYRKIAGSRVTLNTHIDIAIDWASNMRLFEATGVGACLLTERQANLAELFEPDVEVATYGSPEEAAEKARYLLERDGMRRAVAAAGQRRTLKCHTYDHRAVQLDRWIRDSL